MLQGEHSAILSAFIKLPFVISIFVLSNFEWPFYTGFTVPRIEPKLALRSSDYLEIPFSLAFCVLVCTDNSV